MCTGCGRRLPVGHVVCLACGTNISTGAQTATNIKLNRPKPVRATPASIGIGAAISAGAAFGALALWFMVSRASGEPSLVMTVVVGLLAGIGMLIPIRGSGRLATGLIASGCAASAMLIGLLAFDPGEAPETFTYMWYSGGYAPETIEVENLGEDEYGVASALWLALGCCTAFAFGGSNPDPDAEEEVAA